MKNTIQAHFKTCLFSLNFHLLDQLVIKMRKFELQTVLVPPPFKQYDFHVKNAFRCTSQERQSGMEDTLKLLETNQCCRTAVSWE